MGLYLDNGYYDSAGMRAYGTTFSFVWGGRGTGKTVGTLMDMYDNNLRFAYMRRTQAQCDQIAKPELSIWRNVENVRSDILVNIESESRYSSAFFKAEMDGDKRISTGEAIGIMLALSTVSNLRGFSGEWIDYIIYDEFIPEPHERVMRNEWEALLNCYETINRNRELNGKPPCKLIGLSNSNTVKNPIFEGLRVIDKVLSMHKRHQFVSVDRERSLGLFNLDCSPISERKRESALYRLTAGSEFGKMALDNDFNEGTGNLIQGLSIKGFQPRYKIGDMCLYRHKREHIWYCTMFSSGTFPVEYGTSESERQKVRHVHSWLLNEYMRKRIVFETVTAEAYFEKIFLSNT